jgi:hypothetical protein
LKLNLIFEDLGRRFGKSSSLACKIFNSWIPVLSDKLKSLIIWLPREVIREYQIFDRSPQKSDLTSISKVQALSDLSLPTEI